MTQPPLATTSSSAGDERFQSGKRFSLHRPAIAFARHHNLELKACQAGDAKRKGKCERPFRDLKETFLTELDATGAPGSVAELTARAEAYLATRVHSRLHSTTREPPGERLQVERRFLSSLPRQRFDTAYVVYDPFGSGAARTRPCN